MKVSETKDNWENAHQKIDAFYKEVINPVLPKARFSRSFMCGGEDPPSTFDSKLSNENLLDGSVYEYKGKNNFIHFTPLTGLMGILNSGFFRMSEFGNLIDRNELLYGARVFEGESIFNFDETELQQFKENLFCFSMSQYSHFTLKNQFMWEAYANKGKGACIQFRFTKPCSYAFIRGRILCGKNKLEVLRELKKEAIRFHESSRIFPGDFVKLILELQSLHKPKNFTSEKEVRLLFRQDKEKHNKHKCETIYQDVNSNNQVKYFNKMYLKGRNEILNKEKKKGSKVDEKAIPNVFPQVEIKSITLGSALDVSAKTELCGLLNDIKRIFGYNFRIQQITEEEEIMFLH